MSMTDKYNAIYNIFIQSSLTDSLLEQKVKQLNGTFWKSGEVRYFFWRYVFMKDLTKKALTNRLLKAGFDNLTVIEIINALNSTRELVKEILKREE